MEVKLFVGNLSFSTTEDELRALFAQAGTVNSMELIKDRSTGESRGFAFAVMSTQAEAAKATQMFNGYQLGDREIRVSTAREREGSGGGGNGGNRWDNRNSGRPSGHKSRSGGPRRY
ncbi:MAG TPA: RNA-binding protein [Anaerolineaceae bacterium]|nr:RNA-binding protein [Anaerolineaceae bacterium]